MSKKKGPIRTEAVVPSVILLALVYGYFYFFFDYHLKRGIELAATQVHGAEVNIRHLSTSFWRASFQMEGLEVTDKEKPARNLFSVGEMRFQLLWDALLRAKGVVEEASILDIAAFTERKRPGYVLPPPAPGTESGILAKAQAQIVAQTRQRLNDNFLGDIAEVLGGVDPKQQLENIKADLQSVVKAETLEKELKAKKEEWEKRIKELPKPKEIKELEAKVKALNFKSKNPLEIAQNLKQAKAILDEAKAKVDQVNQGQKDLSTDIATYTAAIENLPAMVEKDVQDLQKRLQLPNIDPKEFSTQLFLSQLEGKLVSVRKYVEVARKYMPPKKTKEQIEAAKAEQLVPRARGEGRNYTFPITTGYPLVWLKHAAISSEVRDSEWAGKVRGDVNDFSTEPSLLGKPFRVRLGGEFPKKEIRGLSVTATFDHTTEVARENLKVAVASFPLTELLLSDSPKVRFGIKKAAAGSSFEATLADQTLNFALSSSFRQPEFLLETKNPQVQEILAGALKGIPEVTLGGSVTGSWDSFRFNLDSNLGQALSAGFQKQLEAKLGDAKAKLRGFVDERVAPAKQRAQEQLRALLGGPAKALKQNSEEMDKSLKDAEGSAQAPKGGGLLKGFGL